MFNAIAKLLRACKLAKIKDCGPNERVATSKDLVSASISENIKAMEEMFANSSDFITREFYTPVCGNKKAVIFYIDGLVDALTINNSILRPLMIDSRMMTSDKKRHTQDMAEFLKTFVTVGETKLTDKMYDLSDACLNGDVVLLVDEMSEGICINAKGWEKRAITEPQTETVVKGPREGFTESLRSNTALMRRKIKTPDLRFESMQIADRTRTQVCITYIEGITDPELIKEIKKRLGTINTDALLEVGYIEEFIEDAPFSLFQTISYTEKPDVAAARILEGRAALFMDGTPFALTMPMLFIEAFQSAEDYAVRFQPATFMRILRILAYFMSLLAPATYIALTTFHHELIPTSLLFTVAASREGLPFHVALETSIMLITFETLKEAGVRLPKPIGQAISIVGALVMGQSAIQAGIVGAPVVIIIAFTAVASFVSPLLYDSTSLLRWFFLILGATTGGLGIVLGLIALSIHLASLKSFNTPYLYPFAPAYTPDLKDTVYRAPLWNMRTRPSGINPQNLIRQDMEKPYFDTKSCFDEDKKEGGDKGEA